MKALPYRGQLARREASVLDRQVERRIEPDDLQLRIAKAGLEIGAEVAAVGAVTVEQTLPHPVHRNVVVARDGDVGEAQTPKEPPRLMELRRSGALGQVSRHDDKVGPPVGDQRLHARSRRPVVRRPEVDVGEVKQTAQRRKAPAG